MSNSNFIGPPEASRGGSMWGNIGSALGKVPWGSVASAAGPVLGGLFSQQYEPDPTYTRYANPQGDAMLEEMMRRYGRGGGDFGFGGMAKQGEATLGQFFANRNLNPRSGVATQAYGSMLGDAMAQDADRRRQFLAQLGTAGHQTVSGQHFIGRGF